MSRRARAVRTELGRLADLERALLRLDADAWGYAVTGDPRRLEEWQDELDRFEVAAGEFDRAVEAKRAAVPDERDPLGISEVVIAGRTFIDEHSRPLVQEPTPTGAELTDALNASDAALHALGESFEALQEEENALLTARQDASDEATRRGLVVAALGVGGSILLVVAFGMSLVRWVLRPLRTASTMADQLAQGDLSVRMPTDGIGEIGQLQRSFNTMGDSLETAYVELLGLLDEQASLHRVAALVASGVQPREIFDVVVGEVRRVVGADTTLLLRNDSAGAETMVVASHPGDALPEVGSTWPASDAAAGAVSPALVAALRVGGEVTLVHAPIVVEGGVWGEVVNTWRSSEIDTTDLEQRTAGFTELVATAIANADTLDQLTASRARIVTAGDTARRRIERDLHDGIQQRLVSLALQLRQVQETAPPSAADALAGVSTTLSETLVELQEVSRGIHPAILTQGGLAPAIRTLARRSLVAATVAVEGARRLPEPIEVALYYAAAEALTNTAKHGHAAEVELTLLIESDRVVLRVVDDGVGGADAAAGSGLVGLRDRVESVGGALVVLSPVGVGTSVEVSIPLVGEVGEP